MKYIKIKGSIYHEMLKYDGNPIPDKRNSFCGYIILSLDKILFAYIDDDKIFFDELEGEVLNNDDMVLLYLDILKIKYKNDVVMDFRYSNISNVIVVYVSDKDFYEKHIEQELKQEFEFPNIMLVYNYDNYIDIFE